MLLRFSIFQMVSGIGSNHQKWKSRESSVEIEPGNNVEIHMYSLVGGFNMSQVLLSWIDTHVMVPWFEGLQLTLEQMTRTVWGSPRLLFTC